ncbi:hypothetical protein HMPREF3188_01412 [Tissierellia bacterium KA00581]|jgi:hypothetical protein|nr:hypothetical protein HMPREF3188_01412 [Tissierellia bacterium KA00581]
MKKINALGLCCPQPLILTKKEIENSTEKEFLVMVDNETAVQNLEKFAKSSNLLFNFEKKSDKEFDVFITKTKDYSLSNPKDFCDVIDNSNVVLSISKNFMGDGSEELGKILIKGFIYTVSEYENLPKTIIFFNSGVKLTTEGSECIDDLKKLQAKGVKIVSCGTCLDYYGLKEKLLVGEVTNMYTIYETLYKSSKVISI